MKLKQLVTRVETNILLNLGGPAPIQPRIGDTVRIDVSIQEITKKEKRSGDKKETETRERVQPYEGVVIASRGSGLRKTVTVRRVFQGVGVERVFFVHAPCVKAISIKRRARVRRSKLYFLRSAVGSSIR